MTENITGVLFDFLGKELHRRILEQEFLVGTADFHGSELRMFEFRPFHVIIVQFVFVDPFQKFALVVYFFLFRQFYRFGIFRLHFALGFQVPCLDRMGEYTVAVIQIVIQGTICRILGIKSEIIILDTQLVVAGFFLRHFHEGFEHFLVLLVGLGCRNARRWIQVHTAEGMENNRADKVAAPGDPFDQIP